MSSNLKPASTMPGTRLANHLAGRDAAISSTPTGDFPDPFFPGIEKYKDEPGASQPLSIDGDDPEPQQPPTDKTTRAFRRALIQLVGFTAVIVVLTLVFMARVGGPTGKEDGDQQPITSSASEATTTLHTSQLENESDAVRLPELPVVTPARTIAPTEAIAEATATIVEPASTAAEENEKKQPHKKGCIFSADHDSARFENEHHHKHNKLYAGQFICSQNHQNEGEEHHRYQFGVSNRGDLVLKDRMIAEEKKKHLRTNNNNEYDRILYHHSNKDGDHSTTDEVGEDYHLSLTTDGTLMISASVNEHLWSLPPKNQELRLTEHCLDHHDCPYLHMHPDGVLVVNYIDDDKEWQHKNFFKVYDV